MELILAQGAQHTKPENLKKIINQILTEQSYLRMKQFSKLASDKANHDREKIEQLYLDGKVKADDININLLSYTTEEKYDGYSYLNTDGKFFSKSLSSAVGSKGMPVEKTDRIPHLAKIMKAVYETCGADLHGELYKLGGISDDVTTIMGCTAERAQARAKDEFEKHGHNGLLHYMLIDIRSIYGKSLINEPHRLRRAVLVWVYENIIKPLDPYGYVRLTEEFTTQDPRQVFNRIVTNGGEGIIIKREDALYIPGKKPANNWIKGKKKITHDVFILGFNEGTGKNEKLFGSIRFGHLIDGKIVECGNCSSGLSDEMRLHIYNNADKMIANKQVFEIEAIQESVKSFRNAVFLRLRDDKSWEECTPLNIRVNGDLI